MREQEMIVIEWNWFENSWWKINLTIVSNWEENEMQNRRKLIGNEILKVRIF